LQGLLLSSLLSSLQGRSINIKTDTKINFEVLGIKFSLIEEMRQNIPWPIASNSPFIPLVREEEPVEFYSFNEPDPSNMTMIPLNIPFKFFIHFGSLLIIFFYVGIVVVIWNITEYQYLSRVKLLESSTMSCIANVNRLNLRPSAISLNVHNDITFQSLKLTVGEKVILEGVSGKFKSGRLTAIMGPSGCGKTSMLSVLSGRANYGHTSGHVYINGERSNISKYKKVVGFVPQEDVMIRILTVEEIMEYSAVTRVSSDISNEELKCHVEEVVQLLNLDRIRDSIIGDEDVRGISGGQRKRVNIAMEWVASPGMLFLDEPTSGLDSTSSIEVCQVLRNLAHNAGLTIVAVIHQPRYEIFRMFDDIALLGVGGRPVYLGPTDQVENYFKNLNYYCPPNINPADYYLDVISGLHGPPRGSLGVTQKSVCQLLQAR